METYGLNTGRDWIELQETNSRFIVLDSNDLVVSCNDKAKEDQFTAQTIYKLPSDCFWLDSEQRIFEWSEFKNIVGKEIALVFSPTKYEAHPVKVMVETFRLFDQQFYSLFIQGEASHHRTSCAFSQIAHALREDLKKDLLTLNFQPQINIIDNSLYGVEALARWTSDEFGVVTPDRFVAVAEEFGVIAQLDLWVMRKACEQFVIWQNSGTVIPRIAINFSPLSFDFPLIIDEIRAILDITKIPASNLVIELTENKKIKRPDYFFDVIKELHLMGINISLDDFGAGYSNLKRLLKLPISQLKLDRTFVTELPNRFSKELSEIVLSISEKVGAIAIAEGVETQEQLASLRKIGYQIIQGYLFSPPLSKKGMEEWVHNQKNSIML